MFFELYRFQNYKKLQNNKAVILQFFFSIDKGYFDFILENNSEKSIKESIKLILSYEDWRLHLIVYNNAVFLK